MPLASWNVTVRSAVGSVTVRVVSKSFAVAPSTTMDAPDTLTNGVVREVVTVTALGRPTVTAAVSEPDPETSTSGKEHFQCEYKGDELTTSYNAKYLSETIQHINTDKIKIYLNSLARLA